VTRPPKRSLRCAALLFVVEIVVAACGPGPTPSVAQTAEPVATTDAADPWTRIDVPDPGGVFNDIATTESGVVIVGAAGPAAQLARAWNSPDGLAWAVDQMPSDGRTPSLLMSWKDQLVAIGGGVSNRCAHPAALDSWLRTSDGVWQEAPWADIFCAGGTPSAAAASDHVVVAGSGTGDVPFLWFSNDALRWTDIPLPRDVGFARAVASIGDTDVLMGTSLEGAVWVSSSRGGISWSTPVSIGGPAADVLAVVSLDGRFVAILRTEAGVVGAYESADGVGWTSAQAVGIDGQQVGRVVAIEGGLVALGADESGPKLWVSTNGTSWRAVKVPRDAGVTGSLQGVTVSRGRVFVVGQASSETEAIGAAWMAPASLIAP
jgi:hypothetical protein